jgi:branched-chain amino acid transport system permease protein
MRPIPLGPVALMGAALLITPLMGDQALGLMVQMAAAIILCLSFWLLIGQGGMVSFGHAVYSGAGAFAAVHLMRALEHGLNVPMLAVPLAAGLAAAALAWPLGWLATRHHSATAFAMITLGTGELVWAAAQMFPAVFGGEAGLTANRGATLSWEPDWTQLPALYALAWAYGVLVLWLIRAYTRTPTGRCLPAVRENAQRVAFLGQDPRRIRHLSFVVAAFVAGIAGGLGALFNEIVSTEVLSSHRSAAVLIFTLMGGAALMSGAVAGGVLMVLGSVVLSGWTPAWLLYLGVAFVGVLWLMPGGLVPGGAALARGLLLRPWSALAAVGFMLGFAALVEMGYQWRLSDTLGSQRVYLGLRLDTAQAWHWLLGPVLMALALGLAWVTRRRPQSDQEGR